MQEATESAPDARKAGAAPHAQRPPMNGVRAVLLDLDRTLVDVESEVDYGAALAALEQAGFALCEDLGAATSWGDCTRRVVDLLLGQPDRAAWERVERIVVPYELAGAESAQAMPGLVALFGAIAGRAVGIVTLASLPATQRVVARYGLKVDTVVARSFEVPAKPHPDQLRVALAALGVEPQHAVMVGDSERDEMAALAAGVAFIGVTNGRQDHRFAAGTTLATDLHDVAAWLAG